MQLHYVTKSFLLYWDILYFYLGNAKNLLGLGNKLKLLLIILIDYLHRRPDESSRILYDSPSTLGIRKREENKSANWKFQWKRNWKHNERGVARTGSVSVFTATKSPTCVASHSLEVVLWMSEEECYGGGECDGEEWRPKTRVFRSRQWRNVCHG